jgi:DNA-binding transcriptional ArsR family regulator
VPSLIASLASPRRREILRLVWREEREAGEIHRSLGDVTFGAVSQHLRSLAESGLVDVRSDGRNRIYRARRQAVAPMAAMLESMWDDALYQLKLRAELDESRRGPAARRAGRRGRKRGRK